VQAVKSNYLPPVAQIPHDDSPGHPSSPEFELAKAGTLILLRLKLDVAKDSNP
jgi:hypothetical protein